MRKQLVRNRWGSGIFWIGPAIVGNQRRPSGAQGILIVRIAAQTLVELAVLAQFLAVELHAQSRPIGYPDCTVFISHQAALDNVVSQMMVMRIGRE